MPNVAPVRRKSEADAVAMPARIVRAAVHQESNLLTVLLESYKVKKAAIWAIELIREFAHCIHYDFRSNIKLIRHMLIRHIRLSSFLYIVFYKLFNISLSLSFNISLFLSLIIFFFSFTRAREVAGGCCMSGCCKQNKAEKNERNPANYNKQMMKDTNERCCNKNSK